MKINHKTVFCPIISKHDNGGGIKSTIQLLNGLSKRNKNITVLMRKDATFIDKFENNTEYLKYFIFVKLEIKLWNLEEFEIDIINPIINQRNPKSNLESWKSDFFR